MGDEEISESEDLQGSVLGGTKELGSFLSASYSDVVCFRQPNLSGLRSEGS